MTAQQVTTPSTVHRRAAAHPATARHRRVNGLGTAWSLEAQPWAPGRAFTAVAGRLRKWGLTAPESLEGLVRQLVATVVADGGRHVSIHLAEQDGQGLLFAFSHQPQPPELEDGMLSPLRELGAVRCGTETAVEGWQVWALLDLAA